MLFPTSLLELTRRERMVTALFGRVHVNRFLKGNYFSGLNVINLNSPLVKLLPIINMEQVAMLISEGIPIQLHVSPPVQNLLRSCSTRASFTQGWGLSTPTSPCAREPHNCIMKTYFDAAQHGALQQQRVRRSKLGHGKAGGETRGTSLTCSVTWWPSTANTFHGSCIISGSFSAVKAAKLPRFKSLRSSPVDIHWHPPHATKNPGV